MRKIFLLLSVCIASVGLAQENLSEESYRFKPCDYWSFESGGSGYRCSFLGPYIKVPVMGDIEKLNKTIELQAEKIVQLEGRLAKLER